MIESILPDCTKAAMLADMTQPFRERFRIAADHPALPGHFPGNPVVPGVVLLDRIAAALQSWRGERVAAFPQVKFLLPLLPNETAALILTKVGDETRFVVERETQPIAKGIVVGEAI